MLLPGSYAFLACPLEVPSEYMSDPTKVKVLLSLRSRYRATRGGNDILGFWSNDQPARMAEEPAKGLIRYNFFNLCPMSEGRRYHYQ
jgi:hypothetical protein